MSKLANLNYKNHKNNEPIWHIQLSILIIIVLQLVVDTKLGFSFKYAFILIETLLFLSLTLVSLSSAILQIRRTLAIALIALITACNIFSLTLVTMSLFDMSSHAVAGKDLLISASAIYISNILVFAIWYWEMEYRASETPQDFLFANENAPEHTGLHKTGWQPVFFDYLYLSVTNSTAFSPTDTLPLTHRAKALMTVQSLISLIIIVLVTARAVNILAG